MLKVELVNDLDQDEQPKLRSLDLKDIRALMTLSLKVLEMDFKLE